MSTPSTPSKQPNKATAVDTPELQKTPIAQKVEGKPVKKPAGKTKSWFEQEDEESLAKFEASSAEIAHDEIPIDQDGPSHNRTFLADASAAEEQVPGAESVKSLIESPILSTLAQALPSPGVLGGAVPQGLGVSLPAGAAVSSGAAAGAAGAAGAVFSGAGLAIGGAAALGVVAVRNAGKNDKNIKINATPEGEVTITGTPAHSETLVAQHNLTDANGIPAFGSGGVRYQWLADGVAIEGANKNNFTPSQAQVGKVISVRASYTDNGGTAESVTSAATSPVRNYSPGQSEIDLGEFGKLIKPVSVNGKTYYLLDMNGDGLLNNLQDRSGKHDANGDVVNPNGQGYQFDYVSHDVLDSIFQYASDFSTRNPGGDTNDTYRYAQVNGVRLALPMVGGNTLVPSPGNPGQYQVQTKQVFTEKYPDDPQPYYVEPTGVSLGRPVTSYSYATASMYPTEIALGTAVTHLNANTAQNNLAYDDLLAIWDGFNGNGVNVGGISGTPAGWPSAGRFWAATAPAAPDLGHAVVNLEEGSVFRYSGDTNGFWVVLQVIEPTDTVAPVFGSSSSVSVIENIRALSNIHHFYATDNVRVTNYSFAGGADDDKFILNNIGQLSFKASPDFENPGSAANSNVYTIKVKAVDATGNATVQTLTVNVRDLPETAPIVNHTPTGLPTLIGEAKQGGVFTADMSAVADANGIPAARDGAIQYQWLVDGVPVTGSARPHILFLSQSHVGKRVSVKISWTDNAGFVESVTSDLSPVVQANQAPTIVGIPTTAQSATVGQAAALANFTVADADSSNLRVTLTPTNGTLGNLTDADAATAGIQLTGTAASINAALAAATFTPTAAGAASIGISVSDGVASPVTGTYNLTAVSANQAPTLAGIPATAQSATVGSAAALADFTVADADSSNLRVTLTPTNGTLGNVVDADAATAGIQLTGTAASINAALAAATFTPTAAGAASIGISVSDGVASPVNGTYNLTAVAPNQAPTLAGIPTTAQSATVGQPAALADFTVADADSSNLRVTLTPTNGTLGNLTDADANTAGIQLTGTAASINAALAAATFTPTAAGSASIDISVSDGVASPVNGTYNLTAATAPLTPNTAPTFLLANQAPGKTVVPVGSAAGEIYRATLQADGKVVVVVGHPISGGNQDFRIVRVNADGSPDTSFSGDGHLSLPLSVGDDSSRDVIALSSGKLLVVGQSFLPATGFDFALTRLNADGSLDTSFSGDGMLLVDFALSFDLVHSVVEQADGKLVLAGNINTPQGRDFGLIRLNSDGSLDTTFNGTGKLTAGIETLGNATDEARSVIQQADGKLVVAGFSDTAGGGTRKFSLIRVNTDGTLDTSFSSDGKVLLAEGSSGNEQAFSVIQQADGKLVAVGLSGTDFLAYRLHADGSLDTSFGTSGKVLAPVGPAQDFAFEVVQQADGKLVVGGHSVSPSSSHSFSAVRLNTDGSLDTTFGTGGKVLHDLGSSQNRAYALLLQPDGKLVLAGEVGRPASGVFDVGLIRLNTDGSLDTSFGGKAFSTLGDTASYTEGAAPVVLDSSVQVVDAELAALNNGLGDYSGAVLNVALEGGLGDNNLLFINPTGASFTVVGSVNTQGVLQSFGQTFATFDSRASQLSITFTGSGTRPTQALVNDVASRITYASTDNAPPATVNVRWEFYDENHSGSQGTGGVLRATGLSTVNITPVNDAPTLAGIPTTAQSVTVGAAAVLDNFTVADPDGTNVNLRVTLSPVNGTLGNVTDADANTAGIQLTGTAASINAALANVTFTATNEGAASIGVSLSDGVAAPVVETYAMQATAAPGYTPGQAVIDLGEYGQLINPVNVDGQFYYAWDLNGDGVHNNQRVSTGKFDATGVVANAAGSGFQFDFLERHDVLDNLFVFLNDLATAKSVADTTNDHRFATLNGVKLALPTLGHADQTLASNTFFAGTEVDNSSPGENNITYNDLLAVWDGHNGTQTTTQSNGLPQGWQSASYATATPSPNGHALFGFGSGFANDATDFNLHYVALQVLNLQTL